MPDNDSFRSQFTPNIIPICENKIQSNMKMIRARKMLQKETETQNSQFDSQNDKYRHTYMGSFNMAKSAIKTCSSELTQPKPTSSKFSEYVTTVAGAK